LFCFVCFVCFILFVYLSKSISCSKRIVTAQSTFLLANLGSFHESTALFLPRHLFPICDGSDVNTIRCCSSCTLLKFVILQLQHLLDHLCCLGSLKDAM
jgi:hypothetical protein